jgi:hypothetical protein
MDFLVGAAFWGLIAALGGLLLVVGGCLTWAVLRFGHEATERATATVCGHETTEDGEGVYYAPMFRFAAAGREWQVKGLLAPAGRPPYREGQRLTVYYPKGQPEKAQVHRYEGWWLAFAPVLVGAGLLFGVARELLRLFHH